MRMPPFLAAVLASLVTGTALYFSRAVLDRVVDGDRSTRVAFLPAPAVWVGFAAMAGVAVWWLSRMVRRPRTGGGEPRRPVTGELVLPAFALLALTLPYWPWIPDRLPALQMLAGPGRAVVWLVVLAMIGWAVWRTRGEGRLGHRGVPSINLLTAGVLAGTLAISAVPAAKLTGTVLFPAGDEPHYLVIAQSLWMDGDLAIENNHGRADYRAYFSSDLDPHYLTRGVDGQIYSIHPIGLPVLLAPVYAAGGYRLVVIVLVATAALAAAMMWRWTVVVQGDRAASTFAWLAIAASSPYLLNTFTVYPEIAAALAVVVGFTMALGLDDAPHSGRALVAGLAAATLPWLSTKYAPMSAALIVVALGRVWFPVARGTGRLPLAAGLPASLAIVVPYGVSLLGWFSFFYVYWGSPLPSAPYGALVQTSVKNLIFGAPGLLFDQEYGVLAYAPVYILALTGLALMLRASPADRRRAIEIVLVVGALLGTVGAFRIWWGGSASPGRPMVSGLLLLALPIATAYRAAASSLPRRAAQYALLWLSIGIAGTLVFAQDGMLINNGRDGSSTLLEYLSPLWEGWTLAPSFIHHEAGTAILHTLVWLAVAGLGGLALGRVRTEAPGRAALAALATLGAVLVAVAVVVPLLPLDPPQPPMNLRARSRLPALDSFDRAARPIAIVYDPMLVTTATDVLPRLTLGVTAEMRRGPQPMRVLHNGRFSLPAGRYRVDVQWQEANGLRVSGPQAIDLQVGRIGPPLDRWSLDATPGARASVEFSLPVDAGFVGLRGSTDVERSLASIAITPLEVVDAGVRTRTPQVLAAIRYPSATVLFHDEQLYPEPAGFWTVPGRATTVTLALSGDAPSAVELRMHPGPTPNHVDVATFGWHQDVDLAPGTTAAVVLPDPSRRIVPISIATRTGFVPAQQSPGSGDKRNLGAWVEVAPATP